MFLNLSDFVFLCYFLFTSTYSIKDKKSKSKKSKGSKSSKSSKFRLRVKRVSGNDLDNKKQEEQKGQEQESEGQ